MKTLSPLSKLRLLAFVCFMLLNESCYHYEVATKAQPATNTVPEKITVHSFLWGLYQSPKIITTPLCDTLEVNGVSKVKFTTNFGYSLITVITLGIYCPVQIEWYCSKPCSPTGGF
jgi:Bor protein